MALIGYPSISHFGSPIAVSIMPGKSGLSCKIGVHSGMLLQHDEFHPSSSARHVSSLVPHPASWSAARGPIRLLGERVSVA
jgi:hypothetical protein